MTTDWYARQAASLAFAERWRGGEPLDAGFTCPNGYDCDCAHCLFGTEGCDDSTFENGQNGQDGEEL